MANNMETLKAVDRAHGWEPTSLYVHIPFCASRCHYCDFTTYVAPAAAMTTYVQHLGQELALLGTETTQPLKTIFFGGGTPTVLSAALLQQTLDAVKQEFVIDPDCEWTVEANPGTVTAEKLSILTAAGVNRLSFGAQTFDDRLLMAIGRSHDAKTIVSSVQAAFAAGIAHINVDLMFGLPEQTLPDVSSALADCLGLGVDHVSAYWLKVEPGTPFARWQESGLLPLPGEDAEADMYELVRTSLTAAGFTHYEVSNFTRQAGEARHNLVYWRNEPYLAAGVGAHGYVRGVRYENDKSLAVYAARLAQGLRPLHGTESVSAEQAMEDTMMLGLRLAEGVNRTRFYDRHHLALDDAFAEPIDWGIQHKLLEWDGDVLRLTMSAWPIANVVFEKFLAG